MNRVLTLLALVVFSPPLWAGSGPPSELTCEPLAGAPGIGMTWINEGQYQEIHVFVDGVLTTTLPGSAESHPVFGLSPGVHELCLEAVEVTGLFFPWVCCTVDTGGGGVPPSDLLCEVIGPGEVALSWTNNGTYEEIEILVDGVVVEVILGSESSTVVGVDIGSHTICVQAQTATGPLELLCCEVFLEEPGPIEDLECGPTGPDSVAVAWTNGGVYTSIVIELNGMPVATLPGTATTYEATGLGPGLYTLCVIAFAGAASFDPVCCEAEIVASVAPPQNLSCTVLASGTDVALSWTNPGPYTAIRITVDGNFYAMLPGTATSTTVLGLASGIHVICVIAETAAAVLSPVCCTVAIGVIGEEPSELECAPNPFTGGILVTWTIMDSYSSIDILVDGATVASLPGSATAYNVVGLTPGSHTICVLAYKNGLPLPEVCCDVEIEALGEPPMDLMCGSSPLTGGIVISWTIMDSYSSVEILVDGILDATLPGTTSIHTVVGLAPGPHTICVLAYKNGLPLDPVCCDIVVQTSPSDLDCSVTGPDVAVTWTNPGGYAGIDVLVDGSVWTSLPGTATFVMVTGLASGPHTICVQGVIGTVVTTPVCCMITIAAPSFSRGDANGDGSFDVGDPVTTLGWFFDDGEPPMCLDAADTNDDGQANIADAIYSLTALFVEGPLPPAPYPDCGGDPTGDTLGCAESTTCP